jgi:hypothetical protein
VSQIKWCASSTAANVPGSGHHLRGRPLRDDLRLDLGGELRYGLLIELGAVHEDLGGRAVARPHRGDLAHQLDRRHAHLPVEDAAALEHEQCVSTPIHSIRPSHHDDQMPDPARPFQQFFSSRWAAPVCRIRVQSLSKAVQTANLQCRDNVSG